MTKPKIERFESVSSDRGNLSDAACAKLRAWMTGLGVPKKTAHEHDYAQRVEVKKRGRMVYVRSTYTYRSFPGARGETSPKRTFMIDGTVVAEVDGNRNNCWGSYETNGEGFLATPDDSEFWGEHDSVRPFDNAAHALLRWPDNDEACAFMLEGIADAKRFCEELKARKLHKYKAGRRNLRNYIASPF